MAIVNWIIVNWDSGIERIGSVLSDLCVPLSVLSVKIDFNAETAEEDAEITESVLTSATTFHWATADPFSFQNLKHIKPVVAFAVHLDGDGDGVDLVVVRP